MVLIGIYLGYLFFGSALAQILKPVEAVTSLAGDPSPTPVNAEALLAPVASDTETPISDSAPPTQELPTDDPVAPADTPLPPTDGPIPTPTDTPVPPPAPTEEPPSPTAEAAQKPEQDFSRTVNGKYYDAYVDAATKEHQYYHYTCEFDAAWVVLETNGIDATLQDQIDIVGLDTSVEPTYEETADGYVVYGGDIFNHYSGDYTQNFLARSTGRVIRKIFEHYGLNVTAVNTREDLEAALRRGELVWIKTTADFKPGKPVTWVMPDGETYETVLGNDHAAVVMGYSGRGALIRDVLGPTSTNWNRQYEYEVPWDKFMAAWAQQQYDGLAVGKP